MASYPIYCLELKSSKSFPQANPVNLFSQGHMERDWGRNWVTCQHLVLDGGEAVHSSNNWLAIISTFLFSHESNIDLFWFMALTWSLTGYRLHGFHTSSTSTPQCKFFVTNRSSRCHSFQEADWQHVSNSGMFVIVSFFSLFPLILLLCWSELFVYQASFVVIPSYWLLSSSHDNDCWYTSKFIANA